MSRPRAPVNVLEDLAAQNLRQPYVVAGFGGWINAGAASTTAVEYLIAQLGATRVADLDAQSFYAFSDTRPSTRLDAGRERVQVWPRAEVYVARLPGSEPRDLVLFSGPEPNLRWRGFADSLINVFQQLGAQALISLGAILAPVHHRAPVQVRGWATTAELRTALQQRGVSLSRYEGPTGIATVVHERAHERGLPGAGLTASTPSYVPGMPHPWTARALLRVAAELGGVSFDLSGLDEGGRGLADQIDRFLLERPSLRERIDALRLQAVESEGESVPRGGELPSGEALVHDLEEFLKGLRGEPGQNGQPEEPR